jgi:hypothetical protein
MVEQEAVNFEVTGSSPVAGAIKNPRPFGLGFLCFETWCEDQIFCAAKESTQHFLLPSSVGDLRRCNCLIIKMSLSQICRKTIF